jgi:hypothetical protein
VIEPSRIFELDPQGHAPHALHGFERAFRETNCYVDLFIEILHALELEPAACLAVTLCSDFEGDQWTFFKPQHADLELLYGLRVEELTLWRPTLEQVRTQLARRRIPLLEVDSYFLPDTAASDYRQRHVKTSIAITHADAGARRLRYFHNAGLFECSGDDFDGLFRLGAAQPDDHLLPYCEIIKPERARPSDPDELRAASRELARHYLTLRPPGNPLRAHAAELREHVQWIADGGDSAYHGYSFAALRQLGANFELAAAYLRWLGGGAQIAAAAESFARIAEVAKMLILKLARIANGGRISYPDSSFDEMALAWDAGMAALARGLGRDA